MPGGILDQLSADDRRSLQAQMSRRSFRKHDSLFHEGDPGDTLHVRGRILEVTPSRSKPEMGSFRTETSVTNQNEDVVMTFTSIVLMLRRPSQA